MWNGKSSRCKSLVVHGLLLSNLLINDNSRLKCQPWNQVLPLGKIWLSLVLDSSRSTTKASRSNTSWRSLFLCTQYNFELLELLPVRNRCISRCHSSSGIDNLSQVLPNIILWAANWHWAFLKLIEGWSAWCLLLIFELLLVVWLNASSCSFGLRNRRFLPLLRIRNNLLINLLN